MNRRKDAAPVRTGPCTACGQPVTATQSATEYRKPLGRVVLTHVNPGDCPKDGAR